MCSAPDPMAQSNEDLVPPAASEEQPRAGPLPQGDLSENQKWFPLQIPSHRSGSSLLASGGAGTIESIQLENFMCYAMLGPMKFGSCVSFVVGQRGRSALQAALIVGLGGKSLGSSLGLFVKDGEASANISITIRNTGGCAFKAELYGDSITVQQNISVNGTTSYKLKDQARNVVSSQETELAAILNHFNIQVDSPASILPQEIGRQLLQTRHDSDRYKFFLRLTQLEQMNNDYLSILDKKAQTQDEIAQGEEQLRELKLQGLEIEQAFQNMVGSRKRLEDLKYEMVWAIVIESEKQIADMKSDINIEDQHIIRLHRKMEACQVKFNEKVQKFKKIHKNLKRLNRKAAALETKYTLAEEDVNKKHKACKEAEVLYKSSQNEFKELDKAKQNCNQIEELKKRIEKRKLEKQEKIFMLREKIKNFKDQEKLLVQDMGYLRQAIEKDGVERSHLREEISGVQQKLNDEQLQLNRLKDGKTDPLKIFEPQITTLLEAVGNAHRHGCFISRPVGPLGAYIHLREPEFALAVESCLKDLLLAFCCDNHKDEQVLKGLMKNCYPPGSPRPQIIVSAFKSEVHDVTDRAAFHPEFPTVLTVLEIDNAVVANALIDTRGIESVLLIKSNTLARSVMQTQRPPKNCTEVFTANGDRVLEQHYYSCEKPRPTYLIDREIEISHLEKEIENKMAQLSVYRQHARIVKNDIRKNQATISNRYLHLKEIKVRVKKISMQIKDLENEANQTVDVSVLDKEAQEIKTQMKRVEEKMKIQNEEIKNLRKQKIDAEQRRKNIKLNIDQVSELTKSIKQELNQANLEMDAKKRYLLHYQNRLKRHLHTLQMKKEELTMKERDLEKKIIQAKYICPERKEVNQTTSVLDKEISLLKQKIISENSSHRSKEHIVKQYQEVRERYQGLDIHLKNLKICVKSLDATTAQKYKVYHQFRRSFALRCKSFFDDLMSQCSYSGEMSFDHKNESLSIKVQPKEENKAAFSDMQFLCANSFSNFFFMLTLWSITESPFRCLDTFDIYMDPVSRKIAMDVILKMAHSQKYQQFILLTSQSESSLPLSPLTRMLQLPEVERDQRTLTFQAVSQEEED